MKAKLDFFSFVRKYAVWIVVTAVALIVALLVLDSTGKTSDKVKNYSITVTEYRAQEEKRLKNLLEKTEGVGRADVLITVAKSEEIITAKDVSSQSEKTIVLEWNGQETLSSVSTVSPVVSGVVVICDGGGNALVKNEIIGLVGRLYGLSAAEIYVGQRGD